MTNLEVLEAARAKIAKPANWIRGLRDNGNGAHCALGALDAAGVVSEIHPATELLAASLNESERAKEPIGLLNHYYGASASGIVAKFNNASDHSGVIAAFDRAIERQRFIEAMLDAPQPAEGRVLVNN